MHLYSSSLLPRSFAFFLMMFYSVIGYVKQEDTGSKSYKLGQVITHKLGGREFEWRFSCNGSDCFIGNFIGGDYWIAPKSVDEKVTIHAVSPEGDENGMMANPGSSPEQGFLKCDEKVLKFYSSSLNLMTSLPSVIKPETSLVKAAKRSAEQACWGKNNKHNCCVDAYDVVTILKKPLENSSQYFRPGFAGDEKRLYQLSDLDLKKIPSIKEISSLPNRPSFEKSGERWHSPYVDHYLSFMGDTGRAFAPGNVIPNYGAEQNKLYLDDLINIFGTESIDLKKSAITGLFQRGLDLYTSMQSGVIWPGGAGQSMGRKPPMVFFATLVNDEQVKANVRGMSSALKKNTQEDVQVRLVPESAGGGGQPIWGNNNDFCAENFYWSQLFNSQQYAGGSKVPIGRGDNKRSCGDPYGWIDGPAGLPGTAYMACCSTGGFIEYVLSLSLMPEMCDVAQADILIKYVNRVLNQGVLTQPDICAPPDSRESLDCRAYKVGSPGCLFYGKTWGPDPAKPGHCIKNATGQKGRFPHLNGEKLEKISNEGKLSQLLRKKMDLNILNACNVDFEQKK